MANISKLIVVIGLCFGAVAACSSSDERPTAATRQALKTDCASDADCNYGPGFADNEHCAMDHKCRTIAEDPTCGMWAGTYPNCDRYDPCRQMYCAEGTVCPGQDPYICIHPDGANPCSPYAWSPGCSVGECVDDDDCDTDHACEYSPVGNVCG